MVLQPATLDAKVELAGIAVRLLDLGMSQSVSSGLCPSGICILPCARWINACSGKAMTQDAKAMLAGIMVRRLRLACPYGAGIASVPAVWHRLLEPCRSGACMAAASRA